MVVLRWLARPDPRLLVAALGTAAGLLIPLAGTLVLHGMERDLDDGSWVVTDPDGRFDAQRLRGVERAVRLEQGPDRLLAAYVVGEPGVAPGEARPMPHAPDGAIPGLHALPRATAAADLVPSRATLVHPEALSGTEADMAVVRGDAARASAERRGLEALPADGAVAFAEGGLRQVRASSVALVAVSVPVVTLLAVVFADLDAREQAPRVAVLHALGRPGLARGLLAGRVALLVGGAALAAAVVAWGLHALGGPTFRPGTIPWAPLAWALLLPTAAGGLAGVLRARRVGPLAQAALRGGATTGPPSPTVRRLSPLLQPLVLGVRVLPAVAIAALLFVVDVGLPLAIAGVPGAVTGEDGEAVATSSRESVLFGHAAAGIARVARHDPAVDAIVGEVLVPTVAQGEPVLLRGGEWGDLQSFHGLRLTSGSNPGRGEVVLGERLASRLGLGIGDHVTVPASGRPLAATLEVSGTYAGPGLLEDEGILALADAQDLAGLGPDQVTLVRARPDSREALDAIGRGGADLQVTRLRVTPDDPPAGTLATVRVDVVNLGGTAGTRVLDVRVDGRAVARIEAALAGWAEASYTARFIAPRDGFRVEVNPTVDVQPAPAGTTLEADSIQFDDGPVRVRAVDADGSPVAGVRIRLHADADAAAAGSAPIGEAVTDSGGVASFASVPDGVAVAVTDGSPPAAVQVVVGDAADRGRGRLVAERLWTVPVAPAADELATAYAVVRNLGGREAEENVEVRLAGGLLRVVPVRLAPGDSQVVDAAFVSRPGTVGLEVLDAAAGVEVRQPEPETAPPPAPGTSAAPSAALRKPAADAVLGDARAMLLGLGGTAVASSVALVFLAMARNVQGRRAVFPALWAVGWSPDGLRRRAVAEAAFLGVAAALAALAAGWGLFALAGLGQWPLAFGHAVANPVTPVFAVQVIAAFAAVCALAAHGPAARLTEPGRLRRPGSSEPGPVEPRPVAEVLAA